MSLFLRYVIAASCMLVTIGLSSCTAVMDPPDLSKQTGDAAVEDDLTKEIADLQINSVDTDSVHPDVAPDFSDGRIPAFPGAEGFGAFTPGGRGGRVIEVTSLDDSGPGSLRAAIEAEGPRIVVFRVGGTIELLGRLVIENPFITIAGQTAPGGGIAIKTSPDNKRAALVIETHDVILRYMRLRPGASTMEAHSKDALQINNGRDIIIDHNSLSWATDEVLSTWYASRNISIQWNIISEGLYNSTHEEGAHSMGSLVGSVGAGDITLHHNLYAHDRSRTPRIAVADGVVEVANNVVYNSKFGEPGWGPSHVSDQRGYQRVNYLANFVKLGPDGSIPGYYISVSAPNYGVELYVEGTTIVSIDDEDLIASGDASVSRNPENEIATKHDTPEVVTTDAYQAYQDVLAMAGANFPARDTVDTRIIADVINGTGHWIDSPEEVGGWPVLDAGTPPEDSDHDGMPDVWENDNGFDPADPEDGNGDSDGNGYTNVEEYLNQLVP